VLEALGVRTRVDPSAVKRAIEEVGIGFLFAPTFHGATRHVQPIRLELKMRSAFNFLGPLTNPAGAEMQVAGTWSDEAAEKIAGALASLGLQRGCVVHGSDGLGELTITGPSTVFHIEGGAVRQQTLSPEDFGLEVRPLETAGANDIGRNKAIAESILRGDKGAARDVVLINAALALHTAKPQWNYLEAAERAAESIDSGKAAAKLEKLRETTS
jgi:anthranilate phosphoribosyltransferase